MEQKDDDTHLCLRCSKTIVGLENYVSHRQQHCLGIQTSQDSKEKDLPTDASQPCVVAPLSSSPPQSSSWDVPLTASDFFSCLELQSTVPIPRTEDTSSIPSQQFECSSRILRGNDLELPSTSSNMNCSSFDDTEDCDQGFFSECETNSTEYYPPRTHTGGKWKPGSRPNLKNRQQWGVHSLQSLTSDIEQNAKSFAPQNLQTCVNDSVIDALNFESTTSKSSFGDGIFNSAGAYEEIQSFVPQKIQVGDSSKMFSTRPKSFLHESFNCVYCNEVCPSRLSYTLHLFSFKHKKQFLDPKEYYAEIFKHESALVHTMQFQCHVCSFYCNALENFLFHVEGSVHSEHTSTHKKLICLPWKFHCETSEEIKSELSRNCKNAVDISHPIILLKNKLPLFCDFCVGTCRYLQLSKKNSDFLPRKRVGYRNKRTHQRKLHKKCTFCGQTFMLKEHKKHLRICCTDSQMNEEEAAGKENSEVSACSLGSVEGSTKKLRSVSDVCGDAKEMASECVYQKPFHETDHCREKSYNGDADHLFIAKGSKKAFSCSSCKEIFSCKILLLKHMKCHLAKQKYKCSKCNFKTMKKTLLQRHEGTHSSNRPRPFVCEICGSAQLYKWALVQHMKVHSEGAFRCGTDGCSRVCRTRTELVHHQRVHTNERPYHCNQCNYSGKTAHQLKKHQRTHTGEKPFKCKHCSYSASLSHQLLRHVRVHTGSKPYKCPYCDYVCNNQENIRKHILKTKKHQGVKMYPCTFCSFGCNNFPEFQKHLLSSHKEHFPKGLKDVDSSVVAGLYKKDFPRNEATGTSEES